MALGCRGESGVVSERQDQVILRSVFVHEPLEPRFQPPLDGSRRRSKINGRRRASLQASEGQLPGTRRPMRGEKQYTHSAGGNLWSGAGRDALRGRG